MNLTSSSFSESAAPVPPPPHFESYRLEFRGEGSDFFVLLLKNVVLTILTLGFYSAWARTARRQFIWSNVEIHGQRLVYTGTGAEMFLAYVKVGLVYMAFMGLPALAGLFSTNARAIVQLLVLLPLLLLIPFAVYWSRAYLLSRTTWRGIRFGLSGEGQTSFVKTFLLGYLLSLVTLGLYAPYWNNDMRRILTDNTRFGTEPFRYDGNGRELFWITIKGVLLTLVTLGIYGFWLHAQLQRYYFAHTTFSGARGNFNVTGGTLLKLFLLNLFGTTLTLGLAFPWISVYTARTILTGLSFVGHIDFARIGQAAELGDAEGDALASALDVGLGI
jgi:uncharacterized membrane protein YjgN (DUF898 family)